MALWSLVLLLLLLLFLDVFFLIEYVWLLKKNWLRPLVHDIQMEMLESHRMALTWYGKTLRMDFFIMGGVNALALISILFTDGIVFLVNILWVLLMMLAVTLTRSNVRRAHGRVIITNKDGFEIREYDRCGGITEENVPWGSIHTIDLHESSVEGGGWDAVQFHHGDGQMIAVGKSYCNFHHFCRFMLASPAVPKFNVNVEPFLTKESKIRRKDAPVLP